MSDVMKPEGPKTRFVKRSAEITGLDVVPIDKVTILVREDPFGILMSALTHRLFLLLASEVTQGLQYIV